MLKVKDGINSNSLTATTLKTARTINGTSFNGSSNITTANWGTARTITIGSTGKSVNGSANVSWSLSEIGAAASSHTHNYAGSSSAGGAATSALTCTGNSATATKLATARTINGVSFDGSANITITAAANGGTSAACSGNAATATKLATARTINGTSFNGSANITTANWGTARTLTIGNTGKSVNGSANVSWTLSEIGAAAASHSHSYLPLSGGTINGTLSVNENINSAWSIIIGSDTETSYRGFIAKRTTNGTVYQGRFGSSFENSVKLTSSSTAAARCGAIMSYYTGGSSVRGVLITQDCFIPDADNNSQCGTSSHRWSAVYASTGTVYSSSKDEKENITSLNIAPISDTYKSIKDVIKEGIKNTNMYSYSYKTIGNDSIFIGFLGQELEKQNPEFFNLIGSSYTTEEGNQQYDIRETSVIGVLWSALQDAISENEQQEERIKKLEEQVSNLITTIENK